MRNLDLGDRRLGLDLGVDGADALLVLCSYLSSSDAYRYRVL